MTSAADHEDMTVALVFIALAVVFALSVWSGVDSRRQDLNGHHRPNLL
jgi:hypothetical protein